MKTNLVDLMSRVSQLESEYSDMAYTLRGQSMNVRIIELDGNDQMLEEYPNFEGISKHTQYEWDHNLDETMLLEFLGWVKLTTVCDEYIYMKIEPLSPAQVEMLKALEYEINEEDME